MGWITDLLKEVPLSAVLREKLLEADRRISNLESENFELRNKVKQLEAEVQVYRKKEKENESEAENVPGWQSDKGYHPLDPEAGY